jgi:hypothetical protein
MDDMTEANKPAAGGRATEAGMAFQAAVVAWFAAQLLADVPVGAQFGLSNELKITSLQCETGDALDDVVVRLDGGGAIYTQCKTRPSLTVGVDSLLGKALKQLVDLYVQHGRAALASSPNAALLAVARDAPRSLDTLEAACRLFDHGGSWAAVLADVPGDKRRALSLFESHVRAGWPSDAAQPPTVDDFVALARLLRIRRFAEQSNDQDWRSASHLIGRRLFGGDEAGEAPMTALLGLSRRLIRSGAPVDRSGLLRALRAEGHIDVSAPNYDRDIATVLAYSQHERNRLGKHTRLPLNEGIPIHRDCMDPLIVAVTAGSLLVTGEPGAGKTGVLLNLAARLAAGVGPVLFLSVERFSGFTKQTDFRAELKLEHELVDVLAAWPGVEPGVLIVDALDAARGGPSEAVMAAFIGDCVHRVGARWSIAASIRSFDLRNGRRFREMMPGAPPDRSFVESGLDNVRHFHVPRLSQSELEAVSAVSPAFRELQANAPLKLQELLRNIFNLALAAELLGAGVEAQSVRTVSTQSELIRRYEDIRLPSQELQLAVKATVTVMVHRRQLTVRAVDIEHSAVDDLRHTGVLVAAGDRVAFAHHVLFDHIAGRFYLSWDDTARLQEQVSGDAAIGFVLGPALRFALEHVWQEDAQGRPTTWRFLAELGGLAQPDPIVVSIALRTAAESVETPRDVVGLCAMTSERAEIRPVAKLLSQLARFVGVAVSERGAITSSAAVTWAEVARAAAAGGDPYLADAARVLLMTLAEKANFSDTSFVAVFGDAARSLLKTAWSLDQPAYATLTTAGIRFVAKSYGSDPAASRALLHRILDDRFAAHASQEAPWLAEGVRSIIPHDPVFVAQIYATLFGRDVTDEGKTWVGGSASRILPLTSTRKQDYEHARWHLNEALNGFLEADPLAGTVAVVGAVRGLDTEKRRSRETTAEPTVLYIAGQSVQVVDDLMSLQDWRQENTRQEEPLAAFVRFLKSCPAEAFRDAVRAALSLATNAAVWARILGIAATRPGVAEDLLWPLASDPRFASLQGLARDAVIYLAASYGEQPSERRQAFEAGALAEIFPEGREARWWRSIIARFLSSVPEEQLATPEMRQVRAEMLAGGDLKGNAPFMSMTVGWGSHENIVDSMLRSGGADLERSPDREIRATSRKLEDIIKMGTEPADAASLAILWTNIADLVECLDVSATAQPHPQLVHSSWGAVSNGVELLAKSPAYAPDVHGLPELDVLLALIDRLSVSPYPQSSDTTSKQMAWGNWDVRVYAASSLVALAPRFATARPDIVDRMEACLKDPEPTVRLQVIGSLNVLWNVAHDRMLSLIEEVAAHETNEALLAHFIGGPMWPLSRACPERCARLLSQLLEREWAKTGEEHARRDPDAEASANLTASLYVAHDQIDARTWIERWAADLLRGEVYLSALLYGLRGVFFFPYRDTPSCDELDMASRARRVLDVVMAAAAAALVEARPHLLGMPDDATVAKWRPLYVAADRVIDQVCNQLYFGSGAFRSHSENAETLGLTTALAKQRFLADYAAVLDIVATHAQARTVHNLFELLSYLIEGGPTVVFDRITKILLGPAAQDGYQFESLGLDSLVKLVRRYLADHRDIFEDPERRRALVEVLELFSSAGWPDALKLLFELPDLLR